MKFRILLITMFFFFTEGIGGGNCPLKRGCTTPSLPSFSASFNSAIMSKRIEYQRGEQVGSCIYVMEAKPHICPSGYKKRKAVFQCPRCGKEFEARIDSLRRGDTTSCGCYQLSVASEVHTKHGLRYDPLYFRWEGMIKRCYDPKQQAYKYYGGRGILVYDKWRNDPGAYIKYIKSLANYGEEGLTIDRINNDGNYEPGNLRWTTRSTQSVNQRKYKVNTSGYTGIWWDKESEKYRAAIVFDKNRKHLGYFQIKKDALEARNQYIIDNNLPHKIQEYCREEVDN
jgi:hypothetical protein